MARKRYVSKRDQASREATDSLATLGSQIKILKASLEGLERAYAELKNKLAERLRIEGGKEGENNAKNEA